MKYSYQVSDLKVGKSHGQPRVWLEGKHLERAGFSPESHFSVTTKGRRVTLKIKSDGDRIVSKHQKRGESVPVIDLNSAKDLDVFAGIHRVRVVVKARMIYILPLASQGKAAERLSRVLGKISRGETLTVGSLCHGGGTTSYAVHEGMSEVGVKTGLAFANDVEPEVLFRASEVNPAWNDNTVAVAAPLQEMVTDPWLIESLGHVEILEAGVPCTAASLAGRAKKHLSMAEEDPNAGHLVVPFLQLVEALQPAVVLLENVPPYQNTASAHIIRHTLRDWGYTVSEAVLNAADHGSIEARKRLILVAMTAGLSFDFDAVVTDTSVHHLAEVMEPIAPDDPCWSAMGYLRDKERRDEASGKGFRMQIVGPESTRVGTIGADYQKNRSTEPKVRHPVEGDALLRLLTPREHARIKGVPDSFVDGMPATRAHHLLGNGVSVQVFRDVAKAIGEALSDQCSAAVAPAA